MILKIYDFLGRHVSLRWVSFLAITLVLLASVVRLSYKEDIQDFLPLGGEDRQRMAVYQDISGMNRLFVIFETPQLPSGGVEQTVEAIERFVQAVEESDTAGWCRDMQASFDFESLSETMDFIYRNIPLFLTEKDYGRMDSLLALPGYMDRRLEDDLNALMFPSGDILCQNIARDPLGLFIPPLEALQQSQTGFRFEIYDGCLFTPDMSRAIVMLSSPFGSSETEMNARLVALLNEAIEKTLSESPIQEDDSLPLREGRGGSVKAHVAGGPQIAVGNARQIMHDSILAVALAAFLILALLLYAFRSFRDILLIAVSVGWGWLFAVGGIALVHDGVSMIVIGISSVIIGIAVNYPLHLIAHVRHQPDVRQALREITKPLLVGNITTVGAFLALVPLKSIALRDLGLFASFLLVGTILFVFVWLPHIVVKSEKLKVKNNNNQGDNSNFDSSLFTFHSSLKKNDFLTRLASVQIERKRWLVVVVALLTLVFGYFSFSVEFDSDLSNINYITAEQKADMAYMKTLSDSLVKGEETASLYLLSSASTFDEALVRSESRQAVIDSLIAEGLVAGHRGASRFLPSIGKQAERIKRWNEWLNAHPALLSDLDAAAERQGFAAEAFADFKAIIQSEYAPHPFDDFSPLTSQTLAGNVSRAGAETVIDVLTVGKENVEQVKAVLPDAFDIASLHSSVADALSADFNYVGWVCSAIVFLFLWLSFRRIELAVIAFIPMAVSWIWILGIMALLGIKFNIVNIILATFIFGQGDDYTIFMTEGCVSEYEHGRPVLVPYKRSIILSALIMFIGIGTLIFARHPALHSLAEVTIVGMSSVVLMAYLIPPLLFKWKLKRCLKKLKNEN
ncbi:MAG: MMPL family transporter [Bacteroidaceae bacterium]|nr:MMPL family transporter [Bacteroidaceae bacterium]